MRQLRVVLDLSAHSLHLSGDEVTGLNKKNSKPTVQEAHQLIALYGPEAQAFWIRTLIEEIDVAAKKASDQRTDQKVQLLQSELQRMLDQMLLTDFGTLLASCLASAASERSTP